MIINSGKIFAKVWKVTPDKNGKYIDLQISTSEKDKDGEYKNSNWFPRVIGHAVNTLKDVKREDRIIITKSKFTMEKYEKDGETRSAFKFVIFEAEIDTNGNNNSSTPAPAAKPTDKKPAAPEHDDGDLPW